MVGDDTVIVAGVVAVVFVFIFNIFVVVVASDVVVFARHVIGWINHDIVIGLWTELPVRLSYNIHLGQGKKFWLI